jgi:hypothetical protein
LGEGLLSNLKNDQFFEELFNVKMHNEWINKEYELKEFLCKAVEEHYNEMDLSIGQAKEAQKYINRYFEKKGDSNFAYAWYQYGDKSILFIATSTEVQDYLAQSGDLRKFFEYFYEEEQVKFCVQRDNKGYFPIHRLNEDLEKVDYSRYSYYSDNEINMRKTCAERTIFETIVTRIFNPDFDRNDVPIEGNIKLYTRKDPCFKCYALMDYIKEQYKEKVTLKVYYNKWFSDEVEWDVLLEKQLERFHGMPEEDKAYTLINRALFSDYQTSGRVKLEELPRYIKLYKNGSLDKYLRETDNF